MILNKTKTSHQRLLESLESDVFRFLDFWLLKGVFGFGSNWFILWRIDYFNFEFFKDIFSNILFENIKNMNLINFQFFCINKRTRNHKIIIKNKKNMINFSAIFLHGTDWLNTLFHPKIEIKKFQKKLWV